MNFFVAEKCNPCEIYRRMLDMYRKVYFSQKNVYKGLNIGLPFQVWVKKAMHSVETLTQGNENLSDAVVSKEGHADTVLGHDRIHHY